jgi:hypothetical protein
MRSMDCYKWKEIKRETEKKVYSWVLSLGPPSALNSWQIGEK